MSGVSAEHTSVPRWAPVPPDVDIAGTSFLVLSAGSEGDRVAAAWARHIGRLARPLKRHAADPYWLVGQLASASVGVRVMAAGPELDILDLIRTARRCGLIDAELRVHVTDTNRRRVHCSHCLTQTVTTVAVGGLAGCEGCGRSLFVYHHLSRAHGAYLGFMADAEEPDALAA